MFMAIRFWTYGDLCLITLLMIVISKNGISQDAFIQQYTIEDGLAASELLSVIQDSSGYIWIGTNGGGVSRFDGKQFENFTLVHGLASNSVNCMFIDSKGQHWFGCNDGISLMTDSGFVSYKNEDHPFVDDNITSITEDKAGKLWFSTTQGGIISYDRSHFMNYRRNDSIYVNSIWKIFIDSRNKFWLGSNQRGIYHFDGKTNGSFKPLPAYVRGSVHDIAEDRDGNLWFSTSRGLLKYDGDSLMNISKLRNIKQVLNRPIMIDRNDHIWMGARNGLFVISNEVVRQYTTKDGFIFDAVRDIFEDREGNIWIATNKGLSRFRSTPFETINIPEIEDPPAITFITQGNQNNLFLGISEEGVFEYKNDKWKNLNEPWGEPIWNAHSLLIDSTQCLWIGTLAGIFKTDIDRKNLFVVSAGVANTIALNFSMDKKGRIWACTTHGLYLYKDGDFITDSLWGDLRHSSVWTIFDDHYNRLLVSSYHGSFIMEENDAGKLMAQKLAIDLDITQMVRDKTDRIWANVNNLGIILLDPTGKPLSEGEIPGYKILDTISSEDGLHNNIVQSILVDKEENLWVGTMNGLNKMNIGYYDSTGQKQFKYYGKQDGFSGIECKYRSVAMDHTGAIWFGTELGAIRYRKEFENPNVAPPKIIITNVRLFLETPDWGKFSDGMLRGTDLPLHPEFPDDQNHITFDFEGLSYTDPDKVKYRYRLVNFDKTWSPDIRSDYVTYANLSPGTYTFEVHAANNDEVWSIKPATFTFTVLPPFWQTWWFRGAMVVSIAGFIGLFFRIRVLTYNRDVVRELMHVAIRKLRPEKYVFFKVDGKLVKIDEKDILYAKAAAHFVALYTLDKMYFISSNMKEVTQKLSDNDFVRIHRSYLVRIDRIDSIKGQKLFVNDVEIPVGNTQKDQLELLKNRLGVKPDS